MRGYGIGLCAVALALSLPAARAGAAEAAGEPRTRALEAAWQFSVDDGKTFAAARPEKATSLVARATFSVDDPAEVAGLWLTQVDPEMPTPLRPTRLAHAFAMAGPRESRERECGASPLWTYTRVQLNGADVRGPQEAMVYVALPLEPAGLLKKGENTLTVSGVLWSLATRTAPCPTKPLQLLAAPPQPAPIRGGPLVAAVGPDFATIRCATEVPAAITVTATPTEPAGAASSATSAPALYHEVRVPVPPGTRRFAYTVTSRIGAHEASLGPITARLPPADGRGLKLIAMGNTRCHVYTVVNAPKLVTQMLKVQPDLFVHVGQVVELATWDYHWEPFFYTQYGPLVSTVPTYLSPDGGDHIGRLYRAFGTPAGDDKPLNWTQSFGGELRLIGCDGAYDWSAGSDNVRWLESVLQGAREKYVIVFNHFPGYTDGYQSSPPSGVLERTFPPIKQCCDVILPLLGKHKATALVSAFDYNYERLEPTPDKGVTCIIVGAGGAKTYCQGFGNPFTSTAKWLRITSFVQFEVKDDSCEMTAISMEGEPIDTKTFKPRQL